MRENRKSGLMRGSNGIGNSRPLLSTLPVRPYSEWSVNGHQATGLPISDCQNGERTRRKQKYGNNPHAVVPWPDVKRPILESEDG